MTDITKGVDTEGINAALARVRSDAEMGFDSSVEDIRTLLEEFDRLRSKLDDITEGKTVLIMSEEDRGKDVVHLGDHCLAQWTRWVVLKTQSIHDRKADAADDEDGTPPVSMSMHAGITLGLLALNANAGEMRSRVTGVTYRGEDKGDWSLVVSQGATEAERALRLFRQFVQQNATQWREGTNHHHPIWVHVAELLAGAGINHDVNSGPEWRFIQPGNAFTLDTHWEAEKVGNYDD